MMRYHLILAGMLTVTLAGCSGPNSTARNIETAATINSLAGVPGAGLVGLAASAADVITKSGNPKVGKTSERLSALVAKTPAIFWDSNGHYKWAESYVWRENDETKRIKTDQIPQEMLNYKAGWAKAIGLIPQGIFYEDNPVLQSKNLDALKKGDLVVAEYAGLNGAKIIAVSKNNEPFELMLPEEWSAKNKAGK